MKAYHREFSTKCYSDKEDKRLRYNFWGEENPIIEIDTDDFDVFVVHKIDTGEDCRPDIVLGIRPTFEEALAQQISEGIIEEQFFSGAQIFLLKWGQAFEDALVFIR